MRRAVWVIGASWDTAMRLEGSICPFVWNFHRESLVRVPVGFQTSLVTGKNSGKISLGVSYPERNREDCLPETDAPSPISPVVKEQRKPGFPPLNIRHDRRPGNGTRRMVFPLLGRVREGGMKWDVVKGREIVWNFGGKFVGNFVEFGWNYVMNSAKIWVKFCVEFCDEYYCRNLYEI